jgi:hypothetical protein
MKALLFSMTMLAACTDDPGTAPTISNLTFDPETVIAGQQVTVTGTFTFDDADGDLAQLGVDVTMPDQTNQRLPMTDVRGVGETTRGTLGFQMTLVPPAVGDYQFELFLTDEEEHESNRLAGVLVAE